MAVMLRVHSSRKKSAVEKGTAQWVPIHPSARPPSLPHLHDSLQPSSQETASHRQAAARAAAPLRASLSMNLLECSGSGCTRRDLTEQGQATESFSRGTGQAMHRASCLPPLQRCGRRCNKKVMMWKRACCCLPGVKSVQFVQGPDIFTLF